jgi:endonuclease/exonuclease/phosphatase family metal-dependent hydrolase
MKYSKKQNVIIVLMLFGLFLQAQQLKVMTYNIRLDVASDGENAWPFRKDFFASQIQFYEPDILGVQEVLPHQVHDLEQLLTQYNHVGIGREGFGKGESSNIFFKKEKLEVIETNTFWLSETPEKISMGWDAACNRVCTYSLFKDLIHNRFFWVFNTHLDHIGKEARTKGIELICSKINELNSQNFPVILMGDFNLEPHEKPIQWLKTIMDDTSEKAIEKPFGPIGTFNNFEFLTPVTKRIDYIFISKNRGLNVKKYAVLSDSKNGRYPSDHLPVYVEFN